ncbi:MAG: hypothetical protein ACI8TX_000439 [Hyphomicrobiaceae bacterium]|jgi:hypothetical protein
MWLLSLHRTGGWWGPTRGRMCPARSTRRPCRYLHCRCSSSLPRRNSYSASRRSRRCNRSLQHTDHPRVPSSYRLSKNRRRYRIGRYHTASRCSDVRTHQHRHTGRRCTYCRRRSRSSRGRRCTCRRPHRRCHPLCRRRHRRIRSPPRRGRMTTHNNRRRQYSCCRNFRRQVERYRPHTRHQRRRSCKRRYRRN